MSQTQFQYNYGNQRDAEKNAKRHRSHEFYTVVVQHPKTGRYLVLFCDTGADLPTRVPILWKDRLDPPPVREYSCADRFSALFEMIENGVISIHGVNVGHEIHEEALGDLCDEWINNQCIDWSCWHEK